MTEKYRCPVHGNGVEVIKSTWPQVPGVWCMICLLLRLDGLGVTRAEVVPTAQAEPQGE